MPLLKRDGAGDVVALSKEQNRVVAYRLNPDALKRLRKNGVRVGSEFPSSLLQSLIRTGDAHSSRLADAAGQVVLFGDDPTAENLPRCERTGSTADLHLVVYGMPGEHTAELLSSDARFVLRKLTTLSIPIWVLDTERLRKLELSGLIPLSSKAAEILRQWFRQDCEGPWEKIAASFANQTALDLGPPEG